ncbi:MAG TPA: hypothetical protein VGN80_18955 [Devosiaceae bacterium]|jgi:bifunctional non-homologous end joining protein LigD|nr:hypothetical protein [Devosiaceae bacterium]
MLERPTLPRFIEPAMPQLVDVPPSGAGWIHEIKHDGYRTQLAIGAGEARAFTRRGHDWSKEYAPIVAAASSLPCSSALIDRPSAAIRERFARF